MKTIAELNGKWWFRLLKVLFIFLFVVIFLLSNFLIIANGVRQLDLNNTKITCNFTPFKIISLSGANIYFSDSDFDNYNYKQFYTDPLNLYKVTAIINACSPGDFKLLAFEGNLKTEQAFFDTSALMGSSTFEGLMETGQLKAADVEKNVTYENHIFDIHPVYSYKGFIEYLAIDNLILLFVFLLFRGAFYYITLGSFRPPYRKID